VTVEPPLLRGRLDHVGVAAAGAHPLEGLVAGEPMRRLMPSGVEITRRGGVELVRPGTPDSPIAGFLARRGDGLHHVALAVDEPLGAVVTRLEAAGVRVIGPIVPSADGRPSVFLHPSTMGGVLVELVEGPAG
jgi:methylmalonyl-CoA epimerase